MKEPTEPKTELTGVEDCGGIKFNGDRYTYIPATDELIRDNVLKWKRKQQKAKAKKIIPLTKTQETK